MRNFKTRAAILVALTALTLAACGGKAGSKPGKNGESGDKVSQEHLMLDEVQFAATDNSVREAAASDTAWSMRVSVNGTERVKLNNAPIADVSAAVKGLQFSRRDVLRLEVTIADAADPNEVYGTNMEDVAYRSAQNSVIWAEQCAGQVSPEVDLSKINIPENGALAKIELRICDFVGFSIKPLVEIKPQSKILEKKTVIYHCAVKVSASSNYLYRYGDTPCPYGYATEPNEPAPVISILKKYAPGEPLYTTNILVMNDFKLDLSAAGTIQLKTGYRAPPFGSHEACHTQKVDVKYGTANGIQTARLTFKREGQANGSVIWMPQNSASWPSIAEIRNYYAQAGADERLHTYRVCDWIPVLRPTE